MSDLKRESQIQIKAMDLLAQREYATKELHERLNQRFPDCSVEIEKSLEVLTEKGLLSDQRFVASFINSRIRKGQGPVRIRMELKLRGITEAFIDNALEATAVDWIELAQAVRVKKFGISPMVNYQQRAKVARFLQYRGFGHDEISGCLDES